jgi:hypothetical protein
MARGKRAKAVEAKPSFTALVEALKFVAVAQKGDGAPHETHCKIAHNTVVASNGVLSAGARIEADLWANPHTLRLIDALERCGEAFTVTQIDSTRLSIQSEKFRAVIPCLDESLLHLTQPDEPCAVINDSLKEGFNVVSTLVADNSEFVVTASILLRSGSMVSTNRHIMLEYWHGLDLPALVIPKSAAVAVSKCEKALVTLGFSAGSVTFYFADGSWLKSQQYTDKWPGIDKLLNEPSDAWPVPETFFHGVKAIAPFTIENRVYCHQNILSTHQADACADAGATYEVEGVPAGLIFNLKYLQIIEPYVKTIDFRGRDGKTFFFGDKVRGVVMQIAAT